jgi:lipoyl synthase
VTGIPNSKSASVTGTPLVVSPEPLHVRWLGSVTYSDAVGLQRGLQRGSANHVLLLEHPATYTMGVRAKQEHLLVDVEAAGAALVFADRGGDVTYHGPGQLVGYPIVTALDRRGAGVAGGMSDTAAYVHEIEELVIQSLAAVGLDGAQRRPGHAGVWLDVDTDRQRKIAAIGVRIDRGRTMHGFAINVDQRVDEGFDRIVPCGIHDATVTSLSAEGLTVSMEQLVNVVEGIAIQRWTTSGSISDNTVEHSVFKMLKSDLSVFSRDGSIEPTAATATTGPSRGRESARTRGRLDDAGVDGATAVSISERKPEWMRVKAVMTPEYKDLKRTMRSLDLVTVCEEAGCPNIYECWSSGTATFMVLGERCTRACGFCLVDTRKPLAADADEPRRVAKAVSEMKLKYSVITMVARDDLADGGAAHVAETIRAIRAEHASGMAPQIEVLVSDMQGNDDSLRTVFEARPDVFNHNIESVIRLQRAVRPSASYARSLSVLARAKAAGLTTKSGIIVGMGETNNELRSTLIDLRSVGVDIVTIGQYLRPTERHLPIDRWVTPDEFDDLRAYGQSLGFSHVEASPLTRSSYHAQEGAAASGITHSKLK